MHRLLRKSNFLIAIFEILIKQLTIFLMIFKLKFLIEQLQNHEDINRCYKINVSHPPVKIRTRGAPNIFYLTKNIESIDNIQPKRRHTLLSPPERSSISC